jgi:hypothetical protein
VVTFAQVGPKPLDRPSGGFHGHDQVRSLDRSASCRQSRR